ncbi:MAG: hypothetical protein DCC68_10970 [Planctomycetota bacterium]|nr:MAG: hypothetical protein DCC68_10970 [Planctomycetota bacterium]
MIRISMYLALCLAAFASRSVAAPIYQIDIDSTTVNATTTAPLATEPGWTSLDATAGNGSGVTIDGITFSVGSVDGSRIRVASGLPNPNALTGDFIFDDGANQAVILFFGAAGSLQAGMWQVDLWTYDSLVPTGLDPQIVGYRTNGAETIVSTSVLNDPVNPAISFMFASDGASAYDVFVRDGSTFDRSRLNAVRLTYIPEPSTVVLLFVGAGCLGLTQYRRFRRRFAQAP